MLRFAITLILVCALGRALAFGGASVPWITYEAEDGTSNGTLLGPSYGGYDVASESSGRKCVRLADGLQYVQITAVSNATAIVVRYSVPDTNNVGTDYTISLYQIRNMTTNLLGRLPVTSKYSWRYGTASPLTNAPPNNPRNFFDEVRTNGLSIAVGDVIRLQKDLVDTAPHYDIDLIDLENVSAAISQPGGFTSVTSSPYNADPTGVNDSTAVFNNCISANANIWIPPGSYKITGAINLPSNKTLRGAGMWYSNLVGDPAVYNSNSSKRIILFGNGSNINLSDFSILGKLTYRNDGEPNDGLGGGGSFGTGSTISNVWVEHTKTGAWIINSQGLVVNNCRFRNTIADGINLCVGMRSCAVTNCTARGCGDDSFAMWPATYTTQTYAHGLNVITHCTAQCSYMAQGGAIYGGDSNRIEDCQFQDITYECGILFSTIFTPCLPFSATSVAQRCNIIRCGGTRAGLEINTSSSAIPGLNLNNLNIIDSATTGLKIIGPNSLSGATISNAVISTYNKSGSGGHGLWATGNASGSLTTNNCWISETYDQPGNSFTFNSGTASQYYLAMSAGIGGTVSPASGWYNIGTNLSISANPDAGYTFGSWTGTGTGSYSGSNNPSTVTMNGTITETANFTVLPVQTLIFVQQPSNEFEGVTLTPEVQVQALDSNGVAMAGIPINLSLSSGTGTLSGTLNRTTDAGGIAHFNDLKVDIAGAKLLTAFAGGKSVNSSSFTIIGPAVALAFATQPGAAVAGQPFGQQPVVQSVDAFGTPSTLGMPARLMVSVSRTNGAGTLFGTTTLDIGTGAGNGVVTFTNLALDTAGTGNRLLASTGVVSPANPVPGMSVWLDASVTSSVLTGAGGAVTNWLDLSGNGNDFAFGFGTDSMVYTNVSSPSGRKTVTFVGNGALTNRSYRNATADLSAFIVLKSRVYNSQGNGGQYPAPLSGTDGTHNDFDWNMATFYFELSQFNNGVNLNRGSGGVYGGEQYGTYDPSQAYQVLTYITASPSMHALWVNGTRATALQTSAVGNFNLQVLTLGAQTLAGPAGSGYLDGEIAEVLIYNSDQSANRTAIEAYLTNKWLSAAGGYALSSALSSPFDVQPATIAVLAQAIPASLSFTVDGIPYNTAQVFHWSPGTYHTIATTSPQSGGTGTQYVWSSWSDSGDLSHTVAPTNSTTYTASFLTQYFLTMNASAGGAPSPASDWYNAGTNLNISAKAFSGQMFTIWTGLGSGSYSGTNNPASVTMNGAITQTAGFAPLPMIQGFTVGSDAAVTFHYPTVSGLTYHVETATNLLSGWTPIPGTTTNADGGIIIFVDPNTSGDPQRFYRVSSP
jgi:hypothetical protein